MRGPVVLRIVGAVFVFASVAKAFGPHQLAAFLVFLGLPAGFAAIGVVGVVWFEATLGALLIAVPNWRALGFGTLALTCLLTLVPIVRWLWPEAPGCGCLGSWVEHPALTKPLAELGRNLAMVGLCLFGCLRSKSSTASR